MYPRGTNITSARVIGVCHEKLYRFMFQPTRAFASITNNNDLCELWHRRMAHLQHGAMRVLREIVTGLPEFNTEHWDVCSGCALGKNIKTTFSGSDNRVVGILNLIHCDVCGPMSYGIIGSI